MEGSKSSTEPDIVVLQDRHSMPVENYVDSLRSKLPDKRIRFAKTPGQIENEVARAQVVTGGNLDEHLIELGKNLKWYASASAGTDHIPIELARKRGMAITTASGVHGPSIAEHVIGWMLAFARNHHRGWRRQERHEWRRYPARTLRGTTVTIVGLGGIGMAIEKRLRGFDVESVGIRYTPSKGGPTDEVIGYETATMHEALSRTAYLILTCPLTDTTRGLIGAAELQTLPTDAVLINVSRGSVVDTTALLAALQDNIIRGAALDVTDPEPLPTDHPLWHLTNVFITPHMAGYTPDFWSRRADIFAENFRHVMETGEYSGLRNQVVDPEKSPE